MLGQWPPHTCRIRSRGSRPGTSSEGSMHSSMCCSSRRSCTGFVAGAPKCGWALVQPSWMQPWRRQQPAAKCAHHRKAHTTGHMLWPRHTDRSRRHTAHTFWLALRRRPQCCNDRDGGQRGGSQITAFLLRSQCGELRFNVLRVETRANHARSAVLPPAHHSVHIPLGVAAMQLSGS